MMMLGFLQLPHSQTHHTNNPNGHRSQASTPAYLSQERHGGDKRDDPTGE
jgi:hypothetical protein